MHIISPFAELPTLAALYASLAPQLIGGRLPVFGIRRSLVAQVVNGFGTLIVGIHCTCGLDHGAKFLGILQHGTGLEHILIEGLVVMVGHEQRASQGIQQTGIVDVAV